MFNCLPHNPNLYPPPPPPKKKKKKKSLLQTLLEKEKMLETSIFSDYVFYPIKDGNHHLSYIYFVVCKCLKFDDVQNFVAW